MKVIIFVDGDKELNQLNMIVNKDALNFDMYITSSFSQLTSIFEENLIDIILCQIKLKACDTAEIFQLARMYNPNIIPIAMGYNDCIEDFIKVFNKENVFRFIKMPVDSMFNLINPIKEAQELSRSRIHAKNDVNNIDLENNELIKDINILNDLTDNNRNIFNHTSAFYNKLLKQYFMLTNKDNSLYNELFNNIFSNYVYYFYNDVHDVSQSLNQLIRRAHDPSLNKHFNIITKNTENEAVEDMKLSLFISSFITDYLAAHLSEYNINVLIGNNKGHLLIKYELKLNSEDFDTIINQVKTNSFDMLVEYMRSLTLKTIVNITEDSFEFMVVIN